MVIRRTQTGFTLLELLVALAIFSVMAAMAYSGLNGLIQNRDQLSQVSDRLHELQLTMDTLRRDLSQSIPRPVRDELGDLRPAMAAFPGRFDLELTRGGWPNPLAQPRSHLQRVVYRFEGDELVRYGALVLDGGARTDARRRVLLSGLNSFDVRILDSLGEWQSGWPVDGQPAMPRAVRLEMELEDWGRFARVFPVDAANWAPASEEGS
jgi:general secretion pathway protein J